LGLNNPIRLSSEEDLSKLNIMYAFNFLA